MERSSIAFFLDRHACLQRICTRSENKILMASISNSELVTQSLHRVWRQILNDFGLYDQSPEDAKIRNSTSEVFKLFVTDQKQELWKEMRAGQRRTYRRVQSDKWVLVSHVSHISSQQRRILKDGAFSTYRIQERLPLTIRTCQHQRWSSDSGSLNKDILNDAQV